MQLQIMVWMLVPPPVPLHTHLNIHLPLRKPQSLSFRRLGDISPFPSHTYINQSAYFFNHCKQLQFLTTKHIKLCVIIEMEKRGGGGE